MKTAESPAQEQPRKAVRTPALASAAVCPWCGGRKVAAPGESLLLGIPSAVKEFKPSRAGTRDIGIQGNVKKTTEVMHLELGWAVIELRRRQEWSQTELAHAIDKHGSKTKTTDYMTISRWERGIDSPSPAKRMALAKIATKRGHKDLAKRFRAPVVACHLVAALRTAPVKGS